MAGYIHINLVNVERLPHERRAPEYQLSYSLGDNTYSRVFSEADLPRFLSEAALDPETVRKALDDLRSTGKTTISEVHLSENDAASLGLVQLPAA